MSLWTKCIRAVPCHILPLYEVNFKTCEKCSKDLRSQIVTVNAIEHNFGGHQYKFNI